MQSTMSALTYTLLGYLRTGNPLLDGILVVIGGSIVTYVQVWCAPSRIFSFFRSTAASVELNAADISLHMPMVSTSKFDVFTWFVTEKHRSKSGMLKSINHCVQNYIVPLDKQSIVIDGKLYQYIFSEKADGEKKTCWTCVIYVHPPLNCDDILDMLKAVTNVWRAEVAHKYVTMLMSHNSHGMWESQRRVDNSKSLDNVAIGKEVADNLKRDMDRFLSDEEWYRSKGLPYKRGYLFHGPAGTGKTSIIRAMANRTRKHLYSLNLGNLNDDNSFRTAINSIADGGIVVLEDIDCMGHSLDRSNMGRGPSLSLLLNFLDGINSNHGQIIIMTTNDISKIDPAVLRDGRCDLTLELGNCTEETLQQLFAMFFEDRVLVAPRTSKFKKANPAKVVSILMKERENPDAAAQAILDIIK